MNDLAELLKRQILALGYQNIKECARDRQIPYENLRKVICDKHIPKDKTLIHYAEQMGLEPKDLLRAAYRQKAPESIGQMFETRTPLPRPTTNQHWAPVVAKAACGEWLESYQVEPDIYEPLDLADPEAFFVIAEGDSMIGGNIPPGAHLLVSPAARVANGNVVLARRENDEYTVKIYYRENSGTTVLQPMNSAYKPILVAPKEPLTVFRIVEIRIKI